MRFRGKAALTLLLSVVTGLMALYGMSGYGGSAGNGGRPATGVTRDQVLHGRYLVTAVSGCADCHSREKGPGDPGWLAGFVQAPAAQPFMIQGLKVYPSNLTVDSTGLGFWTANEIFNSLRNGQDPEGMYLAPAMPWIVYRNMTDQDLWAIAAYLKSIKPVENQVPQSEAPVAAGQHGGWESAYAALKPLPPYPAASEVEVR